MRTELMMNKASTSSAIPVSDFYLTAYLICQGMEFLRADPHNPHRVTFLLKDSPGRARLVEDFYGRRAKVDPIAFKSVIIDLKSLIHGVKVAAFRDPMKNK